VCAVPIVELVAQNDAEIEIAIPGASPLALPVRRLRAWVYLADEPFMRQAVIDTGAPYCIFTRRLWTDFHKRGQVDWVAHSPATTTLLTDLPKTYILNGEHRFRVGRIRIRLTETNPNSPVIDIGSVLALCLEDDELDRIRTGLILGLAGILNGCTLVLQASGTGDRWSAILIQT
jgi:hypothetical protein